MKQSTGIGSLFSTFIFIGLVFGVQACGGGGGTSNSAPTASSVSITDDNGGSLVVGDNLTGNYTYADTNGDVEGTSTYRWLRGGVAISGATATTYTLVTADIGESISFEVTPIAATGAVIGSLVVSSAMVLNANPTGYYTGTVTVKQSDNTTDLTISDAQILINGNRIMIMSDAQVVVYDGQMTINGNDFSASMTIYKNGKIPAGALGTTSLSGTIDQGTQLRGDFTGTELGNGSFISTYSTLNNTASAAATIEVDSTSNGWDCLINEAVNLFNLGIDNVGVIRTAGNNLVSSVLEDCNIDGTITPISGTGLYLINVTSVTSCLNDAVNSVNTGAYTGFAITKEIDNPNDRLVFTMTNGTYSTGDDCVFK